MFNAVYETEEILWSTNELFCFSNYLFYLLSVSAKTLLFKNKSDKVYGYLHSTNTFTDDSYAENLLDVHERPRIRRHARC